MKINEIAPYMRYVAECNFNPRNCFVVACDYHFYYVTQGESDLTIDDKNFYICKNTVVIIPPGVKYCFKNSKNLDVIDFNFDYTQNFSYIENAICPIVEEEFKKSMIVEKIDFEKEVVLNDTIVISNMEFLSEELYQIVNEHKYKKAFYQESMSSIFKNIIIEILRYSVVDTTKTEKAIEKVINYIHKNYDKDIKNDIIANIVGYHSYYLNVLMKLYTGMTIHQYLLLYRLEMAKKFLRESEYSIKEIGIRCGYQDETYFSAAFKQKNNIYPSQYRKEAKRLL